MTIYTISVKNLSNDNTVDIDINSGEDILELIHAEVDGDFEIIDSINIHPEVIGDYNAMEQFIRDSEEYSAEIADAAIECEIPTENYYGEYKSLYDFGYALLENSAIFDNSPHGQLIENYFDFERYGSDTLINGFSEYNGIYFSL